MNSIKPAKVNAGVTPPKMNRTCKTISHHWAKSEPTEQWKFSMAVTIPMIKSRRYRRNMGKMLFSASNILFIISTIEKPIADLYSGEIEVNIPK